MAVENSITSLVKTFCRLKVIGQAINLHIISDKNCTLHFICSYLPRPQKNTRNIIGKLTSIRIENSQEYPEVKPMAQRKHLTSFVEYVVGCRCMQRESFSFPNNVIIFVFHCTFFVLLLLTHNVRKLFTVGTYLYVTKRN